MKLKYKLLLFFLISISQNSFSQKDYFNFNKMKIKESINIENNYNSKEYASNSKTYYENNNENLAQPKKYRRPKFNDFPPALISYTFSNNDSIIRSIHYNWNIKINEDISQSKKIKLYNLEFDKMIILLSNYLGEPKPNQGKIIIIKEEFFNNDLTEYYERKVNWEYQDCSISTILAWSKKYGQSFFTYIKWNK